MRVLRARGMRGLRSGRLQGERDVLRGQRAATRASLARGKPTRQQQVRRVPPRLLVSRVPHRLPLRVVRQHGTYILTKKLHILRLYTKSSMCCEVILKSVSNSHSLHAT